MSTALGSYFIKPPQSTFAIALNGDFIGKADYPHTFVKSGDNIDILQPYFSINNSQISLLIHK